MKIKQLLILIVLCAIVGYAGFMLRKKEKTAWDSSAHSMGQKLFAEFPVNDISRIVIRTKDRSAELAKDGDTWIVRSNFSYYADFVKVGNFLKTVRDLKATQVLQVDANDFGRLDLNEPGAESGTGTVIEFYDKNDSVSGKLVLGKEHLRQERAGGYGGGSWPDGRYVYQSQTKISALVSETFTDIRDDGDSWVDKEFVKLDKIRRATAKSGDAVLWTVSRKTDDGPLKIEGEIAADEEANGSKVSGIDGALRYLRFKAVADPSIAEDTYGFASGRQFIADSLDGITYALQIGQKNADGDYPVKVAISFQEPALPSGPDDETAEDKTKREEEFKKKIEEAKKKAENESQRFPKWVFIIPSHSITNLILERAELVKKKSAEATSAAVEEGPQLPPMPPEELTPMPEEEDSAPVPVIEPTGAATPSIELAEPPAEPGPSVVEPPAPVIEMPVELAPGPEESAPAAEPPAEPADPVMEIPTQNSVPE